MGPADFVGLKGISRSAPGSTSCGCPCSPSLGGSCPSRGVVRPVRNLCKVMARRGKEWVAGLADLRY